MLEAAPIPSKGPKSATRLSVVPGDGAPQRVEPSKGAVVFASFTSASQASTAMIDIAITEDRVNS